MPIEMPPTCIAHSCMSVWTSLRVPSSGRVHSLAISLIFIEFQHRGRFSRPAQGNRAVCANHATMPYLFKRCLCHFRSHDILRFHGRGMLSFLMGSGYMCREVLRGTNHTFISVASASQSDSDYDLSDCGFTM